MEIDRIKMTRELIVLFDYKREDLVRLSDEKLQEVYESATKQEETSRKISKLV